MPRLNKSTLRSIQNLSNGQSRLITLNSQASNSKDASLPVLTTIKRNSTHILLDHNIVVSSWIPKLNNKGHKVNDSNNLNLPQFA